MALILGMRALFDRVGCTPTQDEVVAHFGADWRSLSKRFTGRRGKHMNLSRTNGYRRWMRLAGIPSRKLRGERPQSSIRAIALAALGAGPVPTVAQQLRNLDAAVQAEFAHRTTRNRWRCECGALNDPAFALQEGRSTTVCVRCHQRSEVAA